MNQEIELPSIETIRMLKFWGEGRDPFGMGRRPHKRIKGLKAGKPKRGKRNARSKT